MDRIKDLVHLQVEAPTDILHPSVLQQLHFVQISRHLLEKKIDDIKKPSTAKLESK